MRALRQAATTTAAQPAPPAVNRPVERSSRLSTGLLPILLVLLAVASWRWWRRREAQRTREGPPPTQPL